MLLHKFMDQAPYHLVTGAPLLLSRSSLFYRET